MILFVMDSVVTYFNSITKQESFREISMKLTRILIQGNPINYGIYKHPLDMRDFPEHDLFELKQELLRIFRTFGEE